MKKLALILLIFVIFIYGCQKTNEMQKTDEVKSEARTLSDLQITACNTAHEAGTCETRLAELGIILKEDCCEVLGKCC